MTKTISGPAFDRDGGGNRDGGGTGAATPRDAVDAGARPDPTLPDPTRPDGGLQADSVVFVDTGVEGWRTLAEGVDPSAELVLVGAHEDGMRVMADTLAGRSDVQSMHVLGHGGAGHFSLGSARVNAETLDDYAGELGQIEAALSAKADLLLYGCYVGADGAGQTFVDALAEATGADVAASSDATGASDLGGDWDLEIQTGDIEAGIAVDSVSRKNFDAVLPTFDFSSGSVTGSNTNSVTQTLPSGGPFITLAGAGTGDLRVGSPYGSLRV